jgi:hypothetical protein
MAKEEADKAQQETQKTSEVAEQVEKKKGGFLSWLKPEAAGASLQAPQHPHPHLAYNTYHTPALSLPTV